MLRAIAPLSLILSGCCYATVPQKPGADGVAPPPAKFYGVGMNVVIPTDPPVRMEVDAHAADVAGRTVQAGGAGVINHMTDRAAEAQKAQ